MSSSRSVFPALRTSDWIAWVAFDVALVLVSIFTTSCSAPTDSETIGDPLETEIVIDPARELIIVHPTVMSSPEASSATDGPMSFRYLVEQLAPAGVDPAVFVERWLAEEFTYDEFNGYPAHVHPRDATGLLVRYWPKRADGHIDLADSPLTLSAVVNRVDLFGGPGELRFVFGETDHPRFAQTNLSLILEFHLPPIDGVEDSRQEWARRFHALGSIPFGPEYNAALAELVHQVVDRGAWPGRPNGSSLAQVRVNETSFSTAVNVEAGEQWEMREFQLVADSQGAGWLRLAPLRIQPATELNDTPTLTNWVLRNQDSIVAGLPLTLPDWMQPGFVQSRLAILVNAPNTVRNAFADSTCSGCHTGGSVIDFRIIETSRPIDPARDGTERLSSFLREEETPRRAAFMRDLLERGSGPLTPRAPFRVTAVEGSARLPATVVGDGTPARRAFLEVDGESLVPAYGGYLMLQGPGGTRYFYFPEGLDQQQWEISDTLRSGLASGSWTLRAMPANAARIDSWRIHFTE